MTVIRNSDSDKRLLYMNYDFLQSQLFDYLLNVSTAIGSLHQEFWDGSSLLASCLGKQDVLYVTRSIPPRLDS